MGKRESWQVEHLTQDDELQLEVDGVLSVGYKGEYDGCFLQSICDNRQDARPLTQKHPHTQPH